jgi:hypothetical protein
MVARLEPPVPGANVKISPPTFNHWADLPTALNNLILTSINLPLLSDSPATDSNKPLKNKSILKSTMNNIFPPAHAPRASRRSTSEGADPVAFDNNINIPAALGASPVPDNTPTHPTLYKGSLAFGSPRGSKLTRVHQFPSPNTTSDDDQKLPAKKAKKKRRTSKPGRKAYFNVFKINKNFNKILIEDCNLHYHLDNEHNSKLPKQYAAPIIKNIRTSQVATTTNKAAKTQTSTNFTTTDDKHSKSGTTIDLDDPNITNYAPSNDIYKHLGSTGDNEEKELPINTAMYHTNQHTAHSKINTTIQANDLETPPKAPLSPPSKAFVHRLDNSRNSDLSPPFLSNTNPATPRAHKCSQSALLPPLQRHSQFLLASLPDAILSLLPDLTLQLVRAFQQPPGYTPTACPPTGTSPTPTPTHRHYPLLEPEILH